jgi:hypothetical protein
VSAGDTVGVDACESLGDARFAKLAWNRAGVKKVGNRVVELGRVHEISLTEARARSQAWRSVRVVVGELGEEGGIGRVQALAGRDQPRIGPHAADLIQSSEPVVGVGFDVTEGDIVLGMHFARPSELVPPGQESPHDLWLVIHQEDLDESCMVAGCDRGEGLDELRPTEILRHDHVESLFQWASTSARANVLAASLESSSSLHCPSDIRSASTSTSRASG